MGGKFSNHIFEKITFNFLSFCYEIAVLVYANCQSEPPSERDCPKIFRPVCACNNTGCVTYGNNCEVDRARDNGSKYFL